MRVCSACGAEKPIDAFLKKNGGGRKPTMQSICKACTSRQKYKQNTEAILKRQRERAKGATAQEKYREWLNKPETRAARAERKRIGRICALPGYTPAKHDGHVRLWLLIQRQQRWIVKPTKKKACRVYRAQIRAGMCDAHVSLWKSDDARMARWSTAFDMGYRLNTRMRVAVRKALRGKKAGRSWESFVGYSLADLRRHLQRMLPKGKALDDVIAEGWHIDHIVPKSTFDLANEDELRRAWCMSNLRLLPAKENISKNDKRIFLV